MAIQSGGVDSSVVAAILYRVHKNNVKVILVLRASLSDSQRELAISVAHHIGIELIQIPTKKGARTIAIDKSTHLLYLPTAEFDPKEVNERGRPKMKDGTFRILVVGD